MKMLSRLRIALVILVLLSLGSTLPGSAQESCMSDADIQNMVSAGEILPVAQVLEREGIPASTQVLSVKVCESADQLNYVLALLGESGQARNLTVAAR